MKDVTIVIPVKNENPRYSRSIKANADCKVIIVKDKLYGEAIKEGVRLAKTKYIITMDGDGQHRLYDAMKLYKVFRLLGSDITIGERRIKDVEFMRYFASTILNILACIFTNRWVTDLNSGLRVFKRNNALKYEPLCCNTFSYTTSLLMCHLYFGKKVEFSPVNVYPRKEGKSHVRKLKHGLITVYYILKIGIGLKTQEIRKWVRPFTKKLLGR